MGWMVWLKDNLEDFFAFAAWWVVHQTKTTPHSRDSNTQKIRADLGMRFIDALSPAAVTRPVSIHFFDSPRVRRCLHGDEKDHHHSGGSRQMIVACSSGHWGSIINLS